MRRAMQTTTVRNSTTVCRGLELFDCDTSLARYAFSLCRPTSGCFSCCPSLLLYCSTDVSRTLFLFLPILIARATFKPLSAHAHKTQPGKGRIPCGMRAVMADLFSYIYICSVKISIDGVINCMVRLG